MKKPSYLMGMFALASVLGNVRHEAPKQKLKPEETEKSRLTKEEFLAMAEVNRKAQNGLKLFTYGEHQIWALNEKNALRKAKNAGYKKRIEW